MTAGPHAGFRVEHFHQRAVQIGAVFTSHGPADCGCCDSLSRQCGCTASEVNGAKGCKKKC
jgi:hypothetical protein